MPTLNDALVQLEADELDAARATLRALAADPARAGLGYTPEARRAFSFACEIGLLPDDFPARVRAELARALRTGTLADAVARVRDPLGDDPDSPAARVAIHRHAPLLYAALAGTEYGRWARDAAPSPAQTKIAGVSPWVWMMAFIALTRACAAFGG